MIQAPETKGDVAQMVERSLSMREVRGSIPRISTNPPLFPQLFLCHEFNATCHTSIRLIHSPTQPKLAKLRNSHRIIDWSLHMGPTKDVTRFTHCNHLPHAHSSQDIIFTHKSTCVVSSCLVHSFIVKNRDFFFFFFDKQKQIFFG